MKKLFNPENFHPMAFTSIKTSDSQQNLSPSFLFLFAEPGCLVAERFSSYISRLSEKPNLKISFLFPSEKDFLTDRIDHNTKKKYDLKHKTMNGKPLLVDALGRPQEIEDLIADIKNQLYDVEVETEGMIKKKAITRFCDWYFEAEKELFLFIFKDKK